MMMYSVVNESLVKLFYEIVRIEEKAIITEEFKDITNNDMHIIEAIGNAQIKNMSNIAKLLSITVGTLTIAMNNLVKKEYVIRERSEKDRRVVLVSLSAKGRQAYTHYIQFHKEMLKATLAGLREDEVNVLEKALSNLSTFLGNYKK
jgi:DNA-binding MarR family transcriptional regulator